MIARMRTFTLALCLLAGSVAMAQKSDYPRSISIGVRGGVNLSRYLFVPSVSQNQYLGQQAGLVGRWDLEQGASLQAELNYVRTGWDERYDDGIRSSQRQLSYVELPLLTHLYLGKKGMRIFVNIGPFVGYKIGEQHHASGENFTETQLQRQSMLVKHNFAWGLAGGPGLSLALGKRHRIEAEARISYNFQDIWGNKRSDPYGQSTEFRIGVGLSYLYRL